MPETRALLLTDVVDSTKLSEQLGDTAMAQLWAAHDRVARDLLPVHDGLEIDKTDGFLLLFESVPDAVAYAVAYHRAIGALDPPLQARAGLHQGPVILTENAPADVARGAKPIEVDGIAKPTAARVMSLAVGGQTLLTADAVEALGETGLRVQSHGHWRMKGVAEPLELFEVGDEDAPFTPPPDGAKVYRVVQHPSAGPEADLWLPVKEVRHSLPAERDVFVGRRADLLDLAQRLDDGARMVSVLGIGGTGKTRLIIRYGWTWLGDFPGGVWFCDLSEARSVEDIMGAVARAMGVPLGKDDPVVQLGHSIAGRGACLVILDNFEQVARHADETLAHWLDRAPDARFVVTTREVLGLPGEQALALAPLPGSDGAALFVARARAAKRGFEPDDVEAIDTLVELLDGLPLAIELAAARVRVMPPSKLLVRMGQRFKLLASSGGRRDRQATLRATLDWSWDLLDDDEQAALAQLSVFEGGFTLEAAEAALALDEAWPMDAVQALVDKSLVRQVDEERFDLLVSVQEYAAEKVDASGDRDGTEARHGAHFAAFGTDEALDALASHGGVTLRRALARELDNLVAASRRAVAREDDEVAVDTALAASAVLELTGPVMTAVAVLDASRAAATSDLRAARATVALADALATAGRIDEARARYDAVLGLVGEGPVRTDAGRRIACGVHGGLGRLHTWQGRIEEASTHFGAALALAREVGDRRSEGGVLVDLGILHMNQGRMDEASVHWEAALAAHREVGDRRSEGNALANLGIAHYQQGRLDEARDHYEAALAVHREVGNRRSEGIVLANLGNLNGLQGRLEEARANFDAALAMHREVGNRRSEGHVLACLGVLHKEQGRLDEARAHYETALAIHRELGNPGMEMDALRNLATLLATEGRLDEASATYEAALALAREVEAHRVEGDLLCLLAALHLAQDRTKDAHGFLDRAERLQGDAPDEVVLAQVHAVRTRILHAEGDLAAARATLAEAERVLASLGAAPDSVTGQAVAEARRIVDGS